MPDPVPEPDIQPDPTLEPTPEPIPEPTPVPEPAPEPTPEPAQKPESDPAPILLTRAAAAVLLDRHAGSVEVTAHFFPDVPPEAWYAGAVDRLAALGVVRGRGDGCFHPHDLVTRAEFTAMTVRLFGAEAAEPAAFRDIPAGHWAAEPTGAASALGWVPWGTNGYFHPDEPVTDREAEKVLLNAIQWQNTRSR